MNFEQIKKNSAAFLPTYSREEVCFVKGKNATLTSITGDKYIDFASGIGVMSLGYNDHDWNYAIIKQTKNLAHTSNLFYNEPSAKLAKMLTDLSGLSFVFFGNSGAEANECAIKLARKYASDKYEKKRNKIITLKDSFHGRTLATLSATGQEAFHKDFAPLPDGFESVASGDLEGFCEKILKDDVAAVMVELVQGEGGVNEADKEFIEAVCSMCKSNDILFIVDEVQTGIGRCGSLFLFEKYNICPDIVTLAKGLGGGLPIGACLADFKLEKVFSPGDHGSTFGGNPVVCAGACVVLSKMTSNFLKTVNEKGEYIKKELEQFDEFYDITQQGLMIGVSLKTMEVKNLVSLLLENGLVVLSSKHNRLRLLPPLKISYREINKGIKIIRSVLEQ
ncbi:MAG: acetylornithine/succinylornithine family transaminase [Clostridia bacterium]|nr:acetylornithine/succinylornithine family transaminase [Clostridia bacterium]